MSTTKVRTTRLGGVTSVRVHLGGARAACLTMPRNITRDEMLEVVEAACLEMATERVLRGECGAVAGPEVGTSDAGKVVN